MSALLHLLAEGDPHYLLDPHGGGLVFWTGLVFFLVLLALYRLAWGPIVEALDKREDAIAGQVEEAERIRGEAEGVKARYEDQLENIRQEAQKIIDEGESDKKKIIEGAQKKASDEAAAIRARSERDIQLAKQKALAEVKQEAAAMGLAIAEKVIDAELDPSKHKALIDDVIKSYEAQGS